MQFVSKTGPRIISSSVATLLPASYKAPNISPPATDITMFCFKTPFRTAVDDLFVVSAPPGQQAAAVYKQHCIHCAFKTRTEPGTSKVIYSRLAMSGIFQSQRRFHMVSTWAKWCTWLSCTCPFVSSSGDLPHWTPCTHFPERDAMQGGHVPLRVFSFCLRAHIILLWGSTLRGIIWQAANFSLFSGDFSLKWYPSPRLSKSQTKKSRQNFENQQYK